MTKTKLEIISPYTPDHEGPFCTRNRLPVRIISKTAGSKEQPVVGIVIGSISPASWCSDGRYRSRDKDDTHDLMDAREVPVAREFWVNEYRGDPISYAWDNESLARTAGGARDDYLSTIHVREVLPGDRE